MVWLEDSKIIDLFYARQEQAIVELSKKYGAVCSKIARNIREFNTPNPQKAQWAYFFESNLILCIALMR